jgi:hypothetical protein
VVSPEDELEINFVEELKEFDRKTIKEWYNGYSWDIGVSVYNPFSLLNFFTKRKFQNFWFETGTPTFLIKLAEKGQLYNFEEIEVGGNALSSYDIQKLEIIPLMFQTGYLTMKSYSEMSDVYVLGYPNKEVRKSYIEVLMSSYSHSDLGFGVVYVDKIRQYLEKGEVERVEES